MEKIDFPKKAIYQRKDNRFYGVTDFEDGEEIEFYCYCQRPSASAIGNAFYINKAGHNTLVNIKDLIAIE
jgi:hypothetical protein